jgi:hypothetical protein
LHGRDAGEIGWTQRRGWAVGVTTLGAIIAAFSMGQTSANEPAAATANLTQVGRSLERSITSPMVGELVGLDEARASALLGPATSLESRAPATVWHYANSRCELDLMFYMEMRSGQMRSLHYDFKRGADTVGEQQTCLMTIVQGDPKELQPLIEWPELPEPNLNIKTAEIGPAPAQMAQTQTPAPEPKLRRAEVHQLTTRYHRPRRQTPDWGYTASLRYSRPSYADSALVTGWSGGQFGPAPYSTSGP